LTKGAEMFTTKLTFVAPFVVALLGAITALTEPAFAGVGTAVPGPIIGAGLPALAILGGGYWLIRKLRDKN
jgi:hypothetical protein